MTNEECLSLFIDPPDGMTPITQDQARWALEHLESQTVTLSRLAKQNAATSQDLRELMALAERVWEYRERQRILGLVAKRIATALTDGRLEIAEELTRLLSDITQGDPQ